MSFRCEERKFTRTRCLERKQRNSILLGLFAPSSVYFKDSSVDVSKFMALRFISSFYFYVIACGINTRVVFVEWVRFEALNWNIVHLRCLKVQF